MEPIPVIKKGIGTFINDEGLVSICIPRFKKAWMAKLFLPKGKKNEIRINLDLNGTRVWQQIDGNKNIEKILNDLSDIASEEQNFNDRVILFLQGLHKNGFIELMIRSNLQSQ